MNFFSDKHIIKQRACADDVGRECISIVPEGPEILIYADEMVKFLEYLGYEVCDGSEKPVEDIVAAGGFIPVHDATQSPASGQDGKEDLER